MVTTFGDLQRVFASCLQQSPTPGLDARLMIQRASGLSHAELISAAKGVVPTEVKTRADALLTRRRAHEPMAYILGEQEFYGRPFHVSPAVLIPRPETEMLIEAALAVEGPVKLLADLGTGSGCLLTTILAERPEARGLGIDISPAALGVSAANLARHGVRGRALLIERSFTQSLPGQFDLILCNPPYIESEAELGPSVSEHEPHAALFAGADGLDAYRAIAPVIAAGLKPSGQAFLEIGDGQGEAVCQLFRDACAHRPVHFSNDLAGKERMVTVGPLDGET